MEATVYKNATGTNVHEVQRGTDICRTDNLEFAQRIAAALNFFDTVMDSLQRLEEKREEPDNFRQFLIGGSWIAKVGYDYNKNKLRIWKNDDSFFTHLNVPVEVWSELIGAESVGKSYNNNVRGKFELEEKDA